MAGVDFSDRDAATAWFAKQDESVRCAMTCRVALRVLAHLFLLPKIYREPLALKCFRATLIAAISSVDLNNEARESKNTAAARSVVQLSGKAFEYYDKNKNGTRDYMPAFYAANTSVFAALSVADIDGNLRAFADNAAQAAALAVKDAARSVSNPTSPIHADSVIYTATTEDSSKADISQHLHPLWTGYKAPVEMEKSHANFLAWLDDEPNFIFWHDWYLAMWEGRFDDWDLATEVAKIPDAVWEDGTEAVAKEIAAIHDRRAAQEPSEQSVSKTESIAMRERISENRDAIALSVASLLEQLTTFKERVRGINHLDTDFREELLEFIDQLSGKLDHLLHQLPVDENPISDEKAEVLIRWYREFKPLIKTKAMTYVSPDNVSEAALPTAIILGCTAVGTLVGGPPGGGVGALVGGLITNQIKPGKAAETLMKDDDPAA